ncbi:Nif3-like dinuclear metal center hexameric protein [Limosilactobacillus sp.]|uniref:Nif3-like dinuclear metal center hexameric protein n=1 Tax=Limosilactobacillus sp. TaxID=2773925 RepID=UPI00345ECB9E
MITIDQLTKKFEHFASPQLAESWDHVGLQVGSLSQQASKVLVTLDVRPAVIAEAEKVGAQLIFSHHPLMFHPARDLDLANPQNQMYRELLRHDITVYSAHTNLDMANGGMNDWLARDLKLTNVEHLDNSGQDPFTNEEVSLGRVGDLPSAMSVSEFNQYCLQQFHLKGLRFAVNNDDVNRKIQRVAIIGGSAAKYFPLALAKNADAFVTGDVSYHVAQDMQLNHLIMVDPGHHIEVTMVDGLSKLLLQWNQQEQWGIDVVKSQVNTEPFNFVMSHN